MECISASEGIVKHAHTFKWIQYAWEWGEKMCASMWQCKFPCVSWNTWWTLICRQPGDSYMWTHVQVPESWVGMCGAQWMWACTWLNMHVWVREHRRPAHLLLLSTGRKLQYGEDLGWQSGRTRHVCRRWSRIDNMKVIFVYQLKLYRDINKLLSHASLIPS